MIAVVKKNQPLLHARVKALPWRQVPAGSVTRDTGHGRTETRTLKAAHVSRLDFPHARQAIKITRRRQDTATGRASRETVYAVTSRTGSGPANLATIRAAIEKTPATCTSPKADATTPPPAETLHHPASIRTEMGHSRNTPEPWGNRPSLYSG